MAQRTAREKTRNHIAYLESLVRTLQAENKSDGRVARLVAQLDEANVEINRLRNALTSITKITSAACSVPTAGSGVAGTTEEQGEPERAAAGIPETDERHDFGSGQALQTSVALELTPGHGYGQYFPSQNQNEAQNRSAREVSIVDTPYAVASPSSPLSIDNTEDALVVDCLPLTPRCDEKDALSISQMASSITKSTNLEGRLWYLAGTLLNHILSRPQQPFYSAAFDEDIAIRAVTEGWSAVMERYPLDRGWQWLKELDETIYFNSGIPERLMHLRNCRLQFLRQTFPEAAERSQILPAFFAARPSQRYLDHDPLIEHFPWPGFRERLLFFPRKYATDKFMETLRQNVHFVWARGPSELYVKDFCTGIYSYSEAFVKQTMDIRCYSVKADFFEHFPELREDIPFNGPSPVNVLSACVPITSVMSGPALDGCVCGAGRVSENDEDSVPSLGKLGTRLATFV